MFINLWVVGGSNSFPHKRQSLTPDPNLVAQLDYKIKKQTVKARHFAAQRF